MAVFAMDFSNELKRKQQIATSFAYLFADLVKSVALNHRYSGFNEAPRFSNNVGINSHATFSNRSAPQFWSVVYT
jgi:hypothetical protein